MPDNAKAAPEQAPLACSFCGKTPYQIEQMIAGPNSAFICDECVFHSLDLISQHGLNLRAAYFSFQFIAKLLSPIAWLLKQVRIIVRIVAEKSN